MKKLYIETVVSYFEKEAVNLFQSYIMYTYSETENDTKKINISPLKEVSIILTSSAQN